MGSRILQAARSESKITLCCAFIIAATVGTIACPYAEAAGVQTFGILSGDLGIIQDNVYTTLQSSGDVSFLSPGQETLYGIITDGVIAVGRTGTKYNTTIDANDHQVYSGDKSVSYLDGGMAWDTAYISGMRAPMSVNQTGMSLSVDSYANNTTIPDTVENTTVFTRPYKEEMSVSKFIVGSSGQYVADKTVEQGSNESQDYIALNAKASGYGSFRNDVDVLSEVGFIGTSNDLNVVITVDQHEIAAGHYNATSYTLAESFSNAYLNPAFTTEESKQLQSVHMGAL